MAAVTLVIETSNPGSGSPGEVGLARGEEFLAAAPLNPAGRHDDALMPAVAGLCEEHRVESKDLGCVAVSVGPGGYSSVRIAVAAAKMIALTSGAECIPVPTCRVAAAGCTMNGTVAVALAGKRGASWVRVYRTDGQCTAEPHSEGRVLDGDGLRGLIASCELSAVIADHHLPEPLRVAAEEAGIETVAPQLGARACWRAAAGMPSVSPAALAPVYPREPEAVRKWRELGRAT